MSRSGGTAPSRIGARHIVRRYGRVVANDDISLDVASATIHAIVGENGAGKSTLMRILAGLEQPDEGTVTLRGEPVRLRSTRHGMKLGIGMIHQELSIVPTLTLLENLVLGMEPAGRFGRLRRDLAHEAAERLSAASGWSMPWDRLAGDVDIGVRQRVELLRQLYRGADVLILDEPTAALTPPDTESLLAAMRELRAGGTTMLFINHKLDEVAAVADVITVVRAGRVVATVPPDTSPSELAAHIVGASMERTDLDRRDEPAPDVVLSARALSVVDRHGAVRLQDISFDVRRGEILGVYGVAGSGQAELLRSIVGTYATSRDHAVGGTVAIESESVTSLDVGGRRRCGMAFVSPDRRAEGLSVEASILDNAFAGHHRRDAFNNHGVIDREAQRALTRSILDEYDVRCGSPKDPVGSMSGGNQQRLVFGRELNHEPRVLVVAQPTRGIDLRGVERIRTELMQARATGCAVVLASEDLDEVIDLADRILVLRGGRCAGVLDRAEASRERVGELMTVGSVA
ncbi:ABC transporter ATP-binding protein [soil metagenome]